MSDPFERRPYLARIDSVYAILSMNAGGEGVVAFKHGNVWIPMIAADATRLAEMMPHAEAFVRDGGIPARLVRFTRREEIKVIMP